MNADQYLRHEIPFGPTSAGGDYTITIPKLVGVFAKAEVHFGTGGTALASGTNLVINDKMGVDILKGTMLAMTTHTIKTMDDFGTQVVAEECTGVISAGGNGKSGTLVVYLKK